MWRLLSRRDRLGDPEQHQNEMHANYGNGFWGVCHVYNIYLSASGCDYSSQSLQSSSCLYPRCGQHSVAHSMVKGVALHDITIKSILVVHVVINY